jgi:AcrR family transcriptional regulator
MRPTADLDTPDFGILRLLNSCQYPYPVDDVKGRLGDTRVRGYHSPVRTERAVRTRTQILEAAHGLFLERGFARCSVAEIAAAAGVARPTVLAVFGSKAALLRAVVDLAMAGDDEPVPVAQRTWFQPVWTADTQEGCLDAYARAVVRIGRQSSDVIELVRRAADESPENAEMWDELQRNRRFGARTIVTRVRELGPLPRGLTVRRGTDLLFVLNDSGHYRTLVHDAGWSERAFEAWLSDRMRHALLGDSRR